MALKLEDKKDIVAELHAVAERAVAAAVVDYRGLTVVEMTELRAKARKSGVYLKVIRNTLAKRALSGTDFACIDAKLVGPMFLAFATEDPGVVGRLLKDAIRDYQKLTVTALALGGKLLAAQDLDLIAQLPTREQALANLLAVLQAPIVKLVRTLAEPYAKLVRGLAAVRDQK